MAYVGAFVEINLVQVIMNITGRSDAYDALRAAVVKADQFFWDDELQAAIDKLYEELNKP